MNTTHTTKEKKWLSGRAFFYALAITLIIALLSSSFITLVYLQTLRQDGNLLEQRLLRNQNSGLQLLMASSSTKMDQYLDLYGDGLDSLHLKKHNWGLFQIGTVEAYKHWGKLKKQTSKAVLFGSDLTKLQQAALYLANTKTPLALAGNTRIEGTAYLPFRGVKRGYIGGQSYLGTQLVYGEQKVSDRFLPPKKEATLTYLNTLFTPPTNVQTYRKSINQSFQDSTITIAGESVFLNGVQYKGNIVVYAKEIIQVSANSQLEDVILIAPKIVIDYGFQGNIQVFARNEILIGEQVKLNYPSVVCMVKNEISISKPLIKIEKNTTITGLVWIHDEKPTKIPAKIIVEENALIQGQIYCDGTIDLKGKIKGNVSCKKFILVTASSIYDNHLFNATITSKALSEYYYSPIFLKEHGNNKIVKWLH